MARATGIRGVFSGKKDDEGGGGGERGKSQGRSQRAKSRGMSTGNAPSTIVALQMQQADLKKNKGKASKPPWFEATVTLDVIEGCVTTLMARRLASSTDSVA